MNNAALIASLVAIVIAIVAGAKFNINTVLVGMIFAFLIGVLFLNKSLSDVLKAWPYSITFFCMLVMTFYGFATLNGTMEVLAKKMLRLMKGKAGLLLPITLVTCAILGLFGAPAPTLVGPIVFSIALVAGINPAACGMFVAMSSMLGSDNPFTGSAGQISQRLIEQAGYTEYGLSWALRVYGHNCLKGIISLGLVYLIYKAYKGKNVELSDEKIEFNPTQKRTIKIIVGIVLLIVLPVLLKFIFPKSAFFKTLANVTGSNFSFALGILLMIICKCGQFTKAITRIPINMIFMVGGMNLLMGVAKDAGLVDTISKLLSSGIPTWLLPGVIVLIAGFLSFFSGGTSVVCPLMYPLVPGLVAATGLNPVNLFSCVFVGAMSSSTSPYSRGGATAISTCPDPEVQTQLTIKMLPITLIVWLVCAVLSIVGLFKVFSPADFPII